MFLQRLHLQEFRCFSDKTIEFCKPLTIISGQNGQGKTSIIEAIYYLSYFKSFRSHILSDLMRSCSESFFLKGDFFDEQDAAQHSIQIGYSVHKKSIKFDQKVVSSYKQMLHLFQTVSLTEDDMDLIKGSPGLRRAFIDQAVILSHPEKIDLYSNFRKILHQRNALLHYGYQASFDRLEYEIWTQKLLQISQEIRSLRMQVMKKIEHSVNQLLIQYFDGIYQISIEYVTRQNYQESITQAQFDTLLKQELMLKRSVFGAHLDDLLFHIQAKKARIFASRGQQKLIILLAKWALAALSNASIKPIFLMDDFISDFDKLRLKNLITLISTCNNQVILTLPHYDSTMQSLFQEIPLDIIHL